MGKIRAARHPHGGGGRPEGRGRHWKDFVAADFTAADRVVAGTRDAFRGVHLHVIDTFG